MELAAIWNTVDLLKKENEKENEPVNNEYICTCFGYKIISSCGLPVCTNCGLVENYYIDNSPEWTSGVSESGQIKDPSRCGGPQADTDLFSSAWGQGTIINSNSFSTFKNKRMAKINFHMGMNHKDRALFHAYQLFDEAGEGIPDTVIKTAKIMYKKFNEQKLTRGAVRLGIKANCLLLACKIHKISRTTKEIADRFGIPPKDVSRTTYLFKDIIETKNKEEEKITNSMDVLFRLLQPFEYNKTQRKQCILLCEKLENCVELMSKTPNSVASCVIYKVLDYPKSQISEMCSISIPTINKIEVIINKYLEDTK